MCLCMAVRPMQLAWDCMHRHGPFRDTNGSLWVSCDKCSDKFHTDCLSIDPPEGLWMCIRCREKMCQDEDWIEDED